MAKRSKKGPKQVEALKHDAATRRNIPTAELQATAERMEELSPFEPVTYPRSAPLTKGEKRERDEDLDPQIVWKGTSIRLTKDQIEVLKAGEKVELGDAQLVWRGKDNQDWSDLVVQAPPLYIQEKIHPKAIIEDLKRQTKERREEETDAPDLFGDFNGLDPEAKTEFYQHDQHWQNRLILGDSLQVMASLAERENLRGKVQCIYFDPPYGIKFKSNWQVSTRNRNVADGKLEQVTREPEQVKAFRDTWKDNIHSYLTYLRDRLTVMRDLLTDSGSIFVQIGDENVHRVRSLLEEVFGEQNFVSEIVIRKTTSEGSSLLGSTYDVVLWFGRNAKNTKFRSIYIPRSEGAEDRYSGLSADGRNYRTDNITSSRAAGDGDVRELAWNGQVFDPGKGTFKTTKTGLERLGKADRFYVSSNGKLNYVRYADDFGWQPVANLWTDISGAVQSRSDPKIYVVQTGTSLVQRCIIMASDPGDLVLDPTCGSGTTAVVAEQWGRRWITIDTSRVALALARTRMMSLKFPYYLLADSPQGHEKEMELSGGVSLQGHSPLNDLRQGFVCKRVPRVMLSTIARNAEIDVIWAKWRDEIDTALAELNEIVGEAWEEWEVPLDPSDDWSDNIEAVHARWWQMRAKRKNEIDTSISKHADDITLYDQPFEDNSKVRVAGPFTVESLSPHRVISADEDTLIEEVNATEGNRLRPKSGPSAAPAQDFATMVLENLKSAGVHQSDKDDRIEFTAMEGWPGDYIAATGTFEQGGMAKRAAIFIGPEFGSITRSDIMAAAREANDVRFDVLIACGFNFDAHSSEVNKLGPLPILKAKMNPDLHMADDLKNTGKGNLFVVFGEPDVEWDFDDDGNIVVEVLGVDVFDPKTGEVRASGKGDIAAWFIDTAYDEESFFVRHAYFLGANDPYKSLKTTLKAEIDKEAWQTLYRDTSRPFERPSTGRFAVKVINHFGDEVMKIFSV